MDEPITRAEHEAFKELIDAENRRQNKRIDLVEESVRQIGALTTSVEKLALSMESMVKEQEQQGKRLEILESRDGEKWRQVTGYIVMAVLGIALGFLFRYFGIQGG